MENNSKNIEQNYVSRDRNILLFFLMSWSVFILIVVLFVVSSNSKTEASIKEYQLHVEDLSFIEANGYKHNFNGIDEQGSIRVSNNNLDCAILGSGFFRFSKEDDSRFFYSRDGEFKINKDGFIVNKDGFYLEPKTQLPKNTLIRSVSINTNGEIVVEKTDSIHVLQKLPLYYHNNKGYVKEGNYYFFEFPEEIQEAEIIAGALETNNYFVRTKLYSMLQVLYRLKKLNPKNKERYNFRITLIKQLLLSFKELNTKLDREAEQNWLNRNLLDKNFHESQRAVTEKNIDDYIFYQSFYEEIKEMLEFLSLKS